MSGNFQFLSLRSSSSRRLYLVPGEPHSLKTLLHSIAVTGAEGLVALEPWATGFYNALAQYSDRVTVNDAIEAQLCRIHRFLELDESDEDYEQNLAIRRGIEQAHPVRNLEEGMVEMMQGVIEIAKLNCPNKPISRSTPKVGRNDPCPCGSGKKYKNCCGKNA